MRKHFTPCLLPVQGTLVVPGWRNLADAHV